MQPTSYYLAASRDLQQETASFLDWGTAPLVLLLLISLTLRLIHRRRAHAAQKSDRPRPLSAGETVLIGTVDADDEKLPAITIDIQQKGRQWQYRSRWQHQWKEISRRVSVRPFYVATDRGSIRVEPDQRVFLVDALDGEQQTGEMRHRTATLTAGEPVHILGNLVRAPDPRQGGYREAGTGWVLRPPSAGRMLISTEPFRERFLRRARVYRALEWALLALLALIHGGLFFSFNLLRLTGREVVATVRSTDSYRKWHEPKHGAAHWDYYYRVTAEWTDPSGATIELRDHCSKRLYQALQQQQSQEVPFVVSRLWPSVHVIGHEPNADDWKKIIVLLIAFAALAGWGAIVLQTRPWYERRRVIDSGDGPL